MFLFIWRVSFHYSVTCPLSDPIIKKRWKKNLVKQERISYNRRWACRCSLLHKWKIASSKISPLVLTATSFHSYFHSDAVQLLWERGLELCLRWCQWLDWKNLYQIKWAIVFSVCSCSFKGDSWLCWLLYSATFFCPVLVWVNLLAASLAPRVTLVMSSQACESALGRVIYWIRDPSSLSFQTRQINSWESQRWCSCV